MLWSHSFHALRKPAKVSLYPRLLKTTPTGFVSQKGRELQLAQPPEAKQKAEAEPGTRGKDQSQGMWCLRLRSQATFFQDELDLSWWLFYVSHILESTASGRLVQTSQSAYAFGHVGSNQKVRSRRKNKRGAYPRHWGDFAQ